MALAAFPQGAALPMGAALILAACLCYGCFPMGVVLALEAYK